MLARQRRWRARCWALLLAVLVLGWSASSTAHSLGSGYFAHRLEVQLDPQWVRIIYTAEIPLSVLQREFVAMALRERQDSDAAELRAEFRRQKAKRLKAGIEATLNGRPLELSDDPEHEQVTRPNDEVFLLFRYHLRAAVHAPIGKRNRLVVRNHNYRGRRAVYSHAIELAAPYGGLRTGLERDRRFAIDPRTHIKWYFSRKHGDLLISFEGDGDGTGERRGAPLGAPSSAAAGDGEAGRLERFLMAKGLSLRWVVMALVVAFFLGAGHALSPGHGKTVVAAYLVGSRGRVRDAFVLGTTVTLAHTSSVFLLGVVTLLLSQYVLPETLYPYLTLVSGLLIVAVGGGMLVRRVRALREVRASGNGTGKAQHHEHGHEHEHEHEHEHGHGHGRGQGAGERGGGWQGLISLGISGGIVPCPSAIVVLLAAVAYHRLLLGLGMVLTFSLGLAAVLIALGVFMVLAGRLARRVAPAGRWIHWLPVASAVVIVALGAALCVKALTQQGALPMSSALSSIGSR